MSDPFADLPRGRFQPTHGHHGTPTYASWLAMKARCKPRHHAYRNYGARGISVCERWQSFENFLVDMGERPVGTTLDRFPDKDGDYEPGNCRWATWTEQQRNRRNNSLLTHNGETLCLAAWSERAKVSKRTFARRLRAGWPMELALSSPDGRFKHERV